MFRNLIFGSETFWRSILLTTLIFTIFFLPVLPVEMHLRTSRFAYSLIYFSAILSLENKMKSLLVLSIIAFLMEWIAGIFSLWILSTVSKMLNITFFIYVAFSMIHQIATSKEVTAMVILGSVIGYLLLGMIYAVFVAFIMQNDPSAFNATATEAKGITHFSESFYFSFVSLATLGYGDIVPIKPYSRSLAIFISVSGQLYVAVIIALLVGKFSTVSPPEKKQ